MGSSYADSTNGCGRLPASWRHGFFLNSYFEIVMCVSKIEDNLLVVGCFFYRLLLVIVGRISVIFFLIQTQAIMRFGREAGMSHVSPFKLNFKTLFWIPKMFYIVSFFNFFSKTTVWSVVIQCPSETLQYGEFVEKLGYPFAYFRRYFFYLCLNSIFFSRNSFQFFLKISYYCIAARQCSFKSSQWRIFR